ncbi:MAG: alpha-glucosidase C-terminal domain-containing protein [Bacteroidales bacterium]|nr:alpha-glucosidase C-terminal domain-containing protein [Bacteroidales bacterium]
MKIFSKNLITVSALIAVFLITGLSCKQKPAGLNKSDSATALVKHPEWSKNLSIYEINVRQFTPEGTFKALEAHLPRIKELGTDILWIMPVHPIGKLNRKGTLGSYYSVMDYKAINPDFGTDTDFKRFVKRAHELGLYVIIDWVANHSAWDNKLVTEHPEWYVQDSTGKLVSPFDWTDVVKFNYEVPEMRAYMLDALKYWIQDFDIDGYRCDVAGDVPDDFWNSSRIELDKIKPVFMLAESEKPGHHTAFDMTYGWEFHHVMNKIHKGEFTANDIEKYLKKNDTTFAADAYRMTFITNHDENSWNGTEFERLGDGVEAFYVLTVSVPGMPLIYTGQESAMNKRLEFFEKDPVEWGDYKMAGFYKTILTLKKNNPALFNGSYGGSWVRVNTGSDDKIFAILREKDNNRVFSVINLSAAPVTADLTGEVFAGDYTELFTGSKSTLKAGDKIELPAWGYKVFYK